MSSKTNAAALLCASALLILGCEAREAVPNGAAPTQASVEKQNKRGRSVGAGAVRAEERTRSSDGEIPLPLHPPPANADAARWEGVLGLNGRCLVITGDGSPALAAVPVFPDGQAQWDSETRILTFNGKRYTIGDRIVVGGSFNNLGRPGLPAIRDLSPDCPGDSVWLVG